MMRRHTPPLLLALLGSLAACADQSPLGVDAAEAVAARSAPSAVGYVYTQSNEASGNAVLRFARAADGSLAPAGSFVTGGDGAGAGLGSQGAVTLTDDGRTLLVVNAGSSTISAFAVARDGLTLLNSVPSGGTHPISVTAHGGHVYALNDGGAGNIAGFVLDGRGLTPLAGSAQPLSAAVVAPAQLSFTPRGDALVATEKGTNRITTYRVGADGRAGAPTWVASPGMTPFGFAFTQHGDLIVSEAFGGAPGASAVSSLAADGAGAWHAVSATVADHQTAACWVVVTGNGRFAYATNTGSASVSGYAVAPDGSLTLLDASGVTATTGMTPIDAAISRNGQYLYTLNAGAHSLSAFRVANGDGSLAPVAGAAGLPRSAIGLAAQ